VCAVASQSSSPSHMCICNSHPSSELFCIHCICGLFNNSGGSSNYDMNDRMIKEKGIRKDLEGSSHGLI
jgi:hypothetical protein